MAWWKDASQVISFAPDGSDARWLGREAHLSGLTYSYALPGGPDQLSAFLAYPSKGRLRALDAGRRVAVYRGAQRVWDGKMAEASAGSGGWQLQAIGVGNAGTDYAAYWTTWNADDPVDRAISRGLRWQNPGIGGGGNVYLGGTTDPAAVTVSDHLNNITGPAGSVWYVGRNNILTVYQPSWSSPTRLLIATKPPVRNLYGYATVLYGRYQITADNGAKPATFGTTSVSNAANAAKHGTMEFYTDLSAAGTMTAAAAQAVLSSILAKYIAASYGDTFTVRRGQLLTMGGVPVDLGTEQAGFCAQLLMAAGGYGGEMVPAPVRFICGNYSYDDGTQEATITPYQAARFSLGGLLSSWSTLHPAKPPPVHHIGANKLFHRHRTHHRRHR